MLELKLVENTNPILDLIVDSDGRPAQNPQNDDVEWTVQDIPLQLTGGLAAIQSSIETITKALMQARRYEEDREGNPIYLYGRKQAADAWLRTRLRGGMLEDYDIDAAISSGATRVMLTVERQNFWEGTTLISVPITNLNGTDNVSGLNVFNSNDGSGTAPNKRCNYVEIDGDDIDGDIPAAVRLAISGSIYYRSFYGCGAEYDLTAQLMLEGEDRAGGSATADSTCSGGEYDTFSTADWPINSSLVKGITYWAILRAKFTNPGVRVSLGTSDCPKQDYYPDYDTGIFDFVPLGFFHVPNQYTPDSGNIYVQVDFDENVDVDYLMLIPVNSGWREIRKAVESSPIPSGLLDDGIENNVYMLNYTYSLVTQPAGPGVHLRPGKDCRIWFLLASYSAGVTNAAINVARSVTLKYRPRWRML